MLINYEFSIIDFLILHNLIMIMILKLNFIFLYSKKQEEKVDTKFLLLSASTNMIGGIL